MAECFACSERLYAFGKTGTGAESVYPAGAFSELWILSEFHDKCANRDGRGVAPGAWYSETVGTLSASNYTQLAHWITVSRETEPGQQIIVYISGTLSNVNSSAKDWQNIANVCQTFLTTYGVDGVNLDFEPYSTSASNYIGMLTTIRNTIGWTANLSLDYTADSSAFWSGNDFNTISGYINYIMLMIYDSGSTTVAQYDSFIATAMEYAYNWKVHGCAIVPIVPVYASSSVHNPSIENIETSTNEIWYLTQTDPTVEINDIAVWWYDGWNGSNIGNNSMSAPTDAMWTTYWLDR